jgi:hypothetical protein
VQEHEILVKKVLQRLQDEGLAVSMSKSTFHTSEVEFLGYFVSNKGVSMSLSKVESIFRWEAPKNVNDIPIFLGFANFYCRFIKNLSAVCKPISDLVKGDSKNFHRGPEQSSAVAYLKDAFTSAPILYHFASERQTMVEIEASDFALGCVLSQVIDKRLHPVPFHSQKFNKAEVNYEIHDQELLAIITAFKEWRHYLERSKHQAIVYTDHKNLEYFMTESQLLNRRQARWAKLLS